MPRVEVQFPSADEAARSLRAYSRNFGVSGVCLRSRRPYEVGAPVRLSLRVGGETFDLAATVAWTRPERDAVGVRFVDLSAGDRDRLERVMGRVRR